MLLGLHWCLLIESALIFTWLFLAFMVPFSFEFLSTISLFKQKGGGKLLITGCPQNYPAQGRAFCCDLAEFVALHFLPLPWVVFARLSWLVLSLLLRDNWEQQIEG